MSYSPIRCTADSTIGAEGVIQYYRGQNWMRCLIIAFSADVGFINLNITDEGEIAGGSHPLSNFLQQQPSSLVTFNSQFSL